MFDDEVSKQPINKNKTAPIDDLFDEPLKKDDDLFSNDSRKPLASKPPPLSDDLFKVKEVTPTIKPVIKDDVEDDLFTSLSSSSKPKPTTAKKKKEKKEEDDLFANDIQPQVDIPPPEPKPEEKGLFTDTPDINTDIASPQKTAKDDLFASSPGSKQPDKTVRHQTYAVYVYMYMTFTSTYCERKVKCVEVIS